MAALNVLEEKVPMSVSQGVGVNKRLLHGRENTFPPVADYQPALGSASDLSSNALRGRQSIDYCSNSTSKARVIDLWVVNPTVSRDKPFVWLEANEAAVEKYQGEWLLISSDGILAHSKSYKEVRSALQQTKPTEYITYYVPRPDEANFRL